MKALVLTGMLVAASAACGGGVSTNPATGSGGAGGDGGSGSTSSSSSSSAGGGGSSANGSTGVGGNTGGWETLIEGDWSMPSGSEGYICVTVTMQEDVFIKAFRPIAPDGTHHTVLTKGGFGDDGVFPCDAGTNGQNMIYGSGVGTNEMTLPDGVAMKLEAGDKLLLNLHLFNVNGQTITGTSGTQIQRMDPDEVVYEAEGTLAGTFNILLPPQSQGSAVGSCTLPVDTNVFAVGPHMHQLGTHMRVIGKPQGGADVVLHDAAYSFDEQRGYPVAPELALSAGDSVRVECSYDNTTNGTVTFGDSSTQEMCFATLWTYPPPSTGFICNN